MAGNTGARGLGLASLAIGLTEILVPQKVEQAMGIGQGRYTGILRTLGIRELMHGADLLTRRNPRPGVYARVGGDALDGVLLGVAATKTKRPGAFAGIAAMLLGIALLDMIFAVKTGRSRTA